MNETSYIDLRYEERRFIIITSLIWYRSRFPVTKSPFPIRFRVWLTLHCSVTVPHIDLSIHQCILTLPLNTYSSMYIIMVSYKRAFPASSSYIHMIHFLPAVHPYVREIQIVGGGGGGGGEHLIRKSQLQSNYCTVKSRFNESQFKVKSRFKEWNLVN